MKITVLEDYVTSVNRMDDGGVRIILNVGTLYQTECCHSVWFMVMVLFWARWRLT
jgi:hypothetical protein